MISRSEINRLAERLRDGILQYTPSEVRLPNYCKKKIIANFPEIEGLDVDGEAERLRRRLRKLFKDRDKECDENGVPSEYLFANYAPDTIVWNELVEDPITKFLRKQKTKIKETITDMTYQSFEKMAVHLLKTNGVDPVEVTKPGQEGIDFCGYYTFESCPDSIIIPQKFNVKIVGQVKKWDRNIHPIHIISLYYYSIAVKNSSREIVSKFPAWFNDINEPVIGIFVTTSKYTKRAREVAQPEWLILRAGDHVVEGLLKSPDKEKWVTKVKGRYRFVKKAFKDSFKNG